MATSTKSEQAKRRRTIAKGAVAGKPLKAIAREAQCSKRQVQRVEAEPETQFLISEALRPHRQRLTKLAGKVISAVERGLLARKTDKADRIVQLRAVERYADLVGLAQGKAAAPEGGDRSLVTWEEFVILYRSRKEDE
jgi:hypothetical protein